MKERLVTFVAALAALLVSFIILSPPRAPNADDLSLPTTEDSGVNGLKGVKVWLENAGLAVHSLRKRYPSLLDDSQFAPTGNILIVSLPHFHQALASEWQALATWIGRGNSLLLLTHPYNPPSWRRSEGCIVCEAVQLLDELGWQLSQSGAEQSALSVDLGNDLKQGLQRFRGRLQTMMSRPTELDPLSTLATMAGIENLESQMKPRLLHNRWQLSTIGDQMALRLFAVGGEAGQTVLWQIGSGRGQVFLSLAGDILSNEMVGRAGNARWLKNMLSQALSENGRIIFDDYHFGLSDLYDPDQFFSDDRLHRTLGLILLFWFLYVLGDSNRLAPVRASIVRASVKDTVEAMTGFFAARLEPKILAAELTRHLLQDIRLRRGLKDEAAVWQWLERHPHIDHRQLALLRDAMRQRCYRLHVLTDTLTEIRTKTLS